MELSWLDDFLALAACGNFSRAAEARHLTQPAFSRRIRMLEDWVGVTLFDRTAQPVRLTKAGEHFRPVADEVVRRLAQGREDAREAGLGTAATLRFAATHLLSLTFFPDWLRRLEERLPLGAVRLESDTLDACEQLLAQGQVQFLLCHHLASASRLDPRQFRWTRIGGDALVPVAKATASGQPLFALPGSAEAPVPHLAYGKGSGMGRILAAARAGWAAPVWLTPAFTSPLATVLRAVAKDGRGLAWLPESLVAEDLAHGTLARAGGEETTIAMDVVLVRPRSRLAPAAEAFWTLATL